MTFKELLDRHTWEELIPAFQHLYADENLEGYRVAVEELRTLEPTPSTMEIELEFVPDEDGSYVDVHAVEDGMVYALDFTFWQKWLSMSIEHNTLVSYEAEAILVHCLYEMTFYGFSSEKVAEKYKEFHAAIEELGIVDKESEHAE